MAMPARRYESGKYRYGFNGKEKDNGIASDNYDFGARIYDGRIGKWLSVDPLQARYPGLTPYNFCYNSPPNVFDPNGKLGIHVTVQYNSSSKTYTILSITVDDDLKAVAPVPGKGNIGMDFHNYAEITLVDGNGKVLSTQNKTLSFRTNNWVLGKGWAKRKVDDGEYENGGGITWTSEEGGNEGTRKGDASFASNLDLLMTAFSGTKGILTHGPIEFDELEFLEKLTEIIEGFSDKEPGTFRPNDDPTIKKDLDAMKKMLSGYEENKSIPSVQNKKANVVKRVNGGVSRNYNRDPNDGKVWSWEKSKTETKPGLDPGKPDTTVITIYTRPQDKPRQQ